MNGNHGREDLVKNPDSGSIDPGGAETLHLSPASREADADVGSAGNSL